MKSIRTDPRNHAAKGDERIRTAVPSLGTDSAYETRGGIMAEVWAERDRQDAKWGGIPGIERRDDHTYPAVLGEEVGEACQAWLERDPAQLRAELIQTAAVAVAWIEELDNGGMRPRPELAC